MGGDGDALDNNAVTICDACCCTYTGCLFTDGCLGCMESYTCCCCEGELCCKSGQEPLCCLCCALRCVSPSTCIKVQSQLCCLVGAAAFPCDDEVPCMFGTCGVICFPSFGICKTLGELTGKGEGA